MGQLDPKTRSAIIGALRRLWGRHPTRIAVLKASEVREWPTNKDGSVAKRPLVFRRCAECGGLAKDSMSPNYPKAQVDHVEPVIPLDGTLPSWDIIIDRMFTSPENLRVLCTPCHHIKTMAENTLRREARKDAQLPGSVGRKRSPAA